MVIGQQKGINNFKARQHRNFGMANPEGAVTESTTFNETAEKLINLFLH